MKRETLINRIASKEKSIEKLNKRIATINDKIDTFLKNGGDTDSHNYKWLQMDLRGETKELTSETNLLEKYRAELALQEKKEASRNVEAIMNFLEMWKEDCINWFLEQYPLYRQACREYHEKYQELDREYFNAFREGRDKKEISNKRKQLKDNFNQKWSHVMQFNHGSLSWKETMRQDLEDEKIRKYDDLVERVTKVTGTIIDASGLRIDGRSNLNGLVIGEEGSANVETIVAGGWNVQVKHFRTLIHKL